MGVMMQSFYWDCPAIEGKPFQWWKHIEAEVPKLAAAGFTALWLPPANKAASNVSMGYDPYDFWDLGEFDQKGSVTTWFGTREELQSLIAAAHGANLQVYADYVIDHCSGADSEEVSPVDGVSRWTKFTPKSGKFPRDTQSFHPSRYETWDAMSFGGMPDLCHRNPSVYTAILENAEWLINEIGFDGFRCTFLDLEPPPGNDVVSVANQFYTNPGVHLVVLPRPSSTVPSVRSFPQSRDAAEILSTAKPPRNDVRARYVRPGAWLYAAVLTYLTLGPAGIRPETAMPHYLEHLVAFGILGLLLASGYRDRTILLLSYGVGFAALLEIFQIWTPDRHARLIDLGTDASGFCIGVAVVVFILRGVTNARIPRMSTRYSNFCGIRSDAASDAIVFIINSLTVGGAEHTLSELLACMEDELKHRNVHLVLLDAEEERHPVPPWVERHVLNANSSFFWSTVSLLRLLNTLDPAITISFLNRANCATVISSGVLGIPCILSERTYPTRRFGDGLRAIIPKAIMRLTYPHATQIVAVSEGVKTDLAANFGLDPAKICVIHNPIDIERISARALEEPSVEVPQPYIVGSGRLVPSKNFQLLIEAYCASGIAENLVILGEGEARNELEALISRLGVQNRVFLPGHIQNPYPIIRNARIFVSSSNLEGFPNALVEAMALGCPVVATDCDTGPGEILSGETQEKCTKVTFAKFGILVPVNSPDMLCKALRIASRNRTRIRYSELGKKRAGDFSMPSSRDRFWSLLARHMCSP